MPNINCARCGTFWPQAYQFCGRCGGPLHAANLAPAVPVSAIPPPPTGPAPSGPLPLASIRLVVLRGVVSEGASFDIPIGQTAVGRYGELPFPGDPLLADRHMVVDRSPETLDLVGIPGPSGVFRRLREPTLIRSGDVVFAGEQYLLVRSGDNVPFEPASGSDIPVETFGTPLPPQRLHITQLLAGGLPGRVVSTDKDAVAVGRDGSDLAFPQDRFMSGKHLRFEATPTGHIQIIDVGSLNGTFVRVNRLPARLHKGDEILVGSLLFRVEIDVH